MKTSFFSCQHLARQVFRYPHARPYAMGKAIAVTSAHQGAGVSYISRLLTDTLNAETPLSTALIDGSRLLTSSDFDEICIPTHPTILHDGQNGSPYRVDATREDSPLAVHPSGRLHALRQSYMNLILDVPSPRESSDWLSLCPMLDGVIIVVEANKTTSHQLAYLEKTIQGASGVVLGHILNKRTYPIPVWLNTQLERLGL